MDPFFHSFIFSPAHLFTYSFIHPLDCYEADTEETARVGGHSARRKDMALFPSEAHCVGLVLAELKWGMVPPELWVALGSKELPMAEDTAGISG